MLDQSQIDKLLEVISPKFRRSISQPQSGKRQFVQTYDFRRKNQLARDRRLTLERIHDSFAKEVAVYFNNKLRSNVRFKLNSVKQFTIEEYLEILHNPTSLYLVNISPQRRNIVFEFRQEFTFFILDRLLGGPGSTNYDKRELTRIELRVMENIIKDILIVFQTIWEKTCEFEYQIQNYYSSGDYLQFVRRGDSVVTLSFQVSINDKIHLNDVFNITYPFLLIEEMIPVFEMQDRDEEKQVPEPQRMVIQDNVGSIKTPIRVILGKTFLTVQELTKLKIGDVLLLDRGPGNDLSLLVGDHHLFDGKAGLFKNRMAYKITKRC